MAIETSSVPQLDQGTCEDIDSTLQTGKEYIVKFSNDTQSGLVHSALHRIDGFLSELPPDLSYEGTDKKILWRKSCWFACKSLGQPLLDTEDAIVAFDGDKADGMTGLMALRDRQTREAMEVLKLVLDDVLAVCGRSVGIYEELLRRCTVRYRVIKYIANKGNPGGIGLHPDGNALSALITDGDGLRVYDLDGTVRTPSDDGTIVMGGSTLYRWSKGKYPPTFHDVEVAAGQNKVSIVAFFNFPDMEQIPRSVLSNVEESFFHDVRRMKEDDKSPSGDLAPLWDTIIQNHALVLPS